MKSHYPNLVVSDADGQIFEIPELVMPGRRLLQPMLPEIDEFIPLPPGSDLFHLPDRVPLGYDPHSETVVEVEEYAGVRVYPVAAFMAPAYLHHYQSAYVTEDGAPRLPLYCYTAVGWQDDGFVVAASRTDPDQRQDLQHFDLDEVDRRGREMLQRYPKNRLVQHLVQNCVFRYGCPAARNFALERWECPIPTSNGCNAACVGCISEQPTESGIVASMERIDFLPTVQEIVEFTVPHLQQAPNPVVSFGQGCEGEPLLVGDLLEEAIRAIRQRTDRGVININTNASRPAVVERLCRAGLDSIRVSLNSAQKRYYDAYYQPRHYSFDDVLESLRVVRRYRRWASINYLAFAGFTDHPQEMAALGELIDAAQIDMIQTRNLNIDPEWYIATLQLDELSPEQIGMRNWLQHVRSRYPRLRFGYFNPARETMLAS